MNTDDINKQIDHLVSLEQAAMKEKYRHGYTDRIPYNHFVGYRTAGLSLLEKVCGNKHPYFTQFNEVINDPSVHSLLGAASILNQFKHEVNNGWFVSVQELITAEVFADFLEMGKHLLDEGYKDAAAVIIGSVLEKHLRQLSDNNGVDTYTIKGTDRIAKKASLLNEDLKKAGVYGTLDQKSVTSWLDLRNSAAHGKYHEYVKGQVDIMYLGVLGFIGRVK